MHILTKVFIVFAAVLSLVLSVLTMAYAYNADSINSRYTDALQKAASAEAAAQAKTSAYADTSARQQEQIAALQGLLADVEARNADLVRENTTLVSEKQKAENRALAIENQIGDSLETTAAQAAVIDSMRQDNSKLRESELRLRTPVIRGRVSRVSTDTASGEQLIEVDIGSNDRVAENMKLHVGRGTSQFVATLVVVRTDLQSAVARVALTNDGASVREGDLVVSRFSN